MKRMIKLTMKCVAIAFCVLLAACTTDVYEPKPDPVPPTPGKPDPALPIDFNQSTATIHQVTLTVDVNDEYNGLYDYEVRVYDVNPFYEKDPKPLYGGVAKRNDPWVRKMTLPQALETIYIMQIDPRKGQSVKSLSVDPSITTLSCDFNPVPASGTTTKSVLRSGEDEYVPSVGATRITSEQLEEQAFNNQERGTAILNEGEYILTGGMDWTSVNILRLRGNLKLFIKGTLNVSFIDTDGNSTIIIEEGGKLVNMNADNYYDKGNGSKIVIKEGGRLYKENGIADPSIKLYGYNIENYGEMLVDGISGSQTYADQKGIPISIVNYGKIRANNIIMRAGGTIENHCLIEVDAGLTLNGVNMTLAGNTLLKAESLDGTDITCNMAQYSIFRITGQNANFTSGNQALLKGKITISSDEGAWALVDFKNMNIFYCESLALSGNVQLLGHFVGKDMEEFYSYYKKVVSCTNGAKEVNQDASISIPSGDCTGDGNQGSTNPPSNPDYPIVVPNGSYYTFAMEDNWPAFGDYDMNDLVMGISSRLELGRSGYVDKMVLVVDLIAVGATKTLGAGIQFDKLSASKFSGVSALASLFVNNNYFESAGSIESNPSAAVLPLFDDAHWILSGSQERTMLNTSNASKTFYPVRNVMYELTFAGGVSQDDLDISALNFFIVNGGNTNNRSEVHLAGYRPTDRVKSETNGYIANDPSNPDKKMWGFIIPTEFKYAAENNSINEAYPEFTEWSDSSGEQYKDWYEHPNMDHVFKPKETE